MLPRTLPVLLLLAAIALPARAADPIRCGTLQALRDYRERGPEARPVNMEAHKDSYYYPIRLHYYEADEVLVDDTLAGVEKAWRLQIEDWGWHEPGSDEGAGGNDSLDVYLIDVNDAAGICYPETTTIDGDHRRCTSYFVVDRNMAIDSIRSTAHHEFNHVLQMYTDCAEDHQLYEASAVYAQDQPYEDLFNAWWTLAYYQDSWYRSLDYFDYGEPVQYGSFIFLQFLAERLGAGSPISTAELWSDLHQADGDNSNNWMAALERWLPAHWDDELGTPTGDELYTELAWQEYAEWRYFLGANDDGEHFVHGWPGLENQGMELPAITSISFDAIKDQGNEAELEIRIPMAELSSGVVPIRYPTAGWQIDAELIAENDGDRWALTLLQLGAMGQVLQRDKGPIANGTSSVSGGVPMSVLTSLLVVANVGDGTLNPNDDDWAQTGGIIHVTVSGEDAVVGDDDDDDDGGACQCSSAGTPAVGPLGCLLLVGALVGRRLRLITRALAALAARPKVA